MNTVKQNNSTSCRINHFIKSHYVDAKKRFSENYFICYFNCAIFTGTIFSLKQECIPVGCVPPACCPYFPACTAPGAVPGLGVYLVPGGVPGPGPGGYLPRYSPLWTEFLTHASENITLPQTSFAGGNY